MRVRAGGSNPIPTGERHRTAAGTILLLAWDRPVKLVEEAKLPFRSVTCMSAILLQSSVKQNNVIRCKHMVPKILFLEDFVFLLPVELYSIGCPTDIELSRYSFLSREELVSRIFLYRYTHFILFLLSQLIFFIYVWSFILFKIFSNKINYNKIYNIF
jgi:hypothetical protein